MKQKIVFKVSMCDEKSRKKALKIAVSRSGVESAALKGQEKDQIQVVGDGVDAAELTTLLRKKVACAELLMVTPIDEKKEGGGSSGGDQKKQSTNPAAVQLCPAFYPPPYYQQPTCCKDHSNDPSCNIM